MIIVFNPFDWYWKRKYKKLKLEHDDLWRLVDYYNSELEKLKKEKELREQEVMIFREYCENVNEDLKQRMAINVDKNINMKL